MKLTQTSLTALGLILPLVKGNFEIYSAQTSDGGAGGNSGAGIQFYPQKDGDINCDDVLDWIWGKEDDVSGTYGYRTETDDEWGVRVLEFNTAKGIHFTYYADRDGEMWGLEGEVLGHCRPLEAEQQTCGLTVGQALVTRWFTCDSVWSEEDINDQKP